MEVKSRKFEITESKLEIQLIWPLFQTKTGSVSITWKCVCSTKPNRKLNEVYTLNRRGKLEQKRNYTILSERTHTTEFFKSQHDITFRVDFKPHHRSKQLRFCRGQEAMLGFVFICEHLRVRAHKIPAQFIRMAIEMMIIV